MAATPTIPNKVMLTQTGFQQIERTVDPSVTTLLPGMFCQRAYSGGVETVIIQNTAGGVNAPLIAIEDGLQGNGMGTTFTAGQPVQLAIPLPGTLAQAMLTKGVAYVPGDVLIYAGDGSLKKTTGTPLSYVAEIEVAIDLTAAATNSPGIVRFTSA